MLRGTAEYRGEVYRTGDLIFFEGQCFTSNVIKVFQWSRWSHIGVIVVNSDGIPMVYESSHSGHAPDVITGELQPGVQLSRLDDRLELCNQRVAIRHLTGVCMDGLYVERALELMEDLRGRPFEQNLSELARAGIGFLPKNEDDDLSSIFCSELTAAFYQALGVMCICQSSNNFTPAQFATRHKVRLLKGRLGPLRVIQKRKTA